MRVLRRKRTKTRRRRRKRRRVWRRMPKWIRMGIHLEWKPRCGDIRRRRQQLREPLPRAVGREQLSQEEGAEEVETNRERHWCA